MSKRLVIIDGMSVFYRGYYAMPSLSTKDGTPTGGVYGFTSLALEIIKQLEPNYVCVAWDKSKTSTRKRLDLYPEYKAGRKPPPPDFYAQIPILKELLEAFSWPLYECDDYEADDIIATLAKKAEAKDIQTIIIGSDLDLLQAVTAKTHMYALKKGFSNIQQFDEAEFENKYGIKVEQFIDLKAIMGDGSDNIPGVSGIGKKGAAELLQQFGTLENVYENLDLVKESMRKKLEASRDMAFLSKKIVTLMLDAPVDLDLKAMDVNDVDAARVRADLQKLEFHSLLRSLPKTMVDAAAPILAPQSSSKLTLPKVHIHNRLDNFSDIDTSKPVFTHVFCKGRFGDDPQAVLLANDNKSLHIYKSVGPELRTQNSELRIYGYATKHSLQMLIRHGFEQVEVEHDIKVGAFLINPLIREQSLSAIALSDAGYDIELDDLDVQEFISKAPEMCAIIHAVVDKQKDVMQKTGRLKKLAEDIEWPVIPVLARIELAGMKLDADYLRKMGEEMSGKISDLEQTIYGYADEQFNISSPTQLADILYDKLGLPTQGVKKGKTGYSTAASELSKLRNLHPIIEYISEYRELTKLKSTYIDTLPEHQGADGRVRSDLRLTVAATGRLSSSEPNLQNIPVRSEVGKKIRNAFVAEPGNLLVSADYSQFELRLAAVLAGDNDMVEAFNSDEDIHTLTASQVFGVALEDVTREMRYDAKTVNFGILYGQGSHGLAQQTGMSYGEAKEFIDKYFEKRAAIREYIKHLREQAKEQGYVETMFGRRRPTPDVASSNFIVREAAYRQAVNMPIQGSEADLMKMAMIKLENEFNHSSEFMVLSSKQKPRQIMQVHDSIIVECREQDAEKVSKLMKETMENIYPSLEIKLKVDVSVGTNWGDL
ncbi:DNA polymerase I [Candidatus Saccharibacteria bacterium]|nr:DNA polymerase I [Candidatus Saccharibacteria bacterium]MCB9821183.1 DNA polymerase I [Candidatus Nomurabacteria bacterium]